MATAKSDDAEAGKSLVEAQKDQGDYGAVQRKGDKAQMGKLFSSKKTDDEAEVVDCMTYQTHQLTTWTAFTTPANTVWMNRTLWMMMVRLIMLSLFVAVIVLLAVPDPVTLRTHKFTKISTFLNVFVGLLLGFFMSSSMNRWYSCASGFLELFDAIRNLQMQFFALGVEESKINLCIRYGVLSAHLLNMELHAEALPAGEKEAAARTMWENLKAPEGETESGSDRLNIMYPQERDVLEKVDDPSGLMWIWVGSFVGRLANDGDIPLMASPTYGRIIGLAQDAHGGIRQVRASISVQAPFIYVHMLATLVHINNILNAVSFGFTVGTCASVILMFHKVHPMHEQVDATEVHVYRDIQNVVVSFFFSMFGPFLYQALLEVAICIAQPFASEAGKIPMTRLLARLEKDLHDGSMMANRTPWWDQPRFKKVA